MTTATTNEHPCLFIEAHDRNSKELKVCLTTGPTTTTIPDWKESLQQMPNVEAIHFYGNHHGDDQDMKAQQATLLQLAFALQQKSPLHGISKLQFESCQLDELGHLSLLAAKNPHDDSGGKLLALDFCWCIIEDPAAMTLCYLLESNLVGELSFMDCSMEPGTAMALAASLGKNKSLRDFQCVDVPDNLNLVSGVLRMLKINQHLVTLSVHLTDDGENNGDSCWAFFRAAQNNNTLQSLQINGSHLNLHSMEAIMMMCWMMDSLQYLAFDCCEFTQEAMEFLNKTLSNRKVLNGLTVESVRRRFHTNDQFWNVNLGKVQVQKLSLKGTRFVPDVLLQMIDDISNNPLIQSLNVGDVLNTDEALQKFCQVVLRQNRGPTELSIDGDERYANILLDALRQNSSIQSLIIQDPEETDLLPYLRGLAGLNQLRKLSLRCFGGYILPEECFQALEQSLEQNTTLQSLEIHGISLEKALAKRVVPKLRYYLAINRIRRHTLLAEAVPDALWARVLGKTSREAAGINFVLRGKPEIVVAPTTTVRKRKSCDEG